MKSFSLVIILLACSLCTNSFAQTLNLKQGTVLHNEAERPAIVVTLEPSAKEVESAWEAFLKSEHKIKLSGAGSRNLSGAKEVVFGAISTKTMDFYSMIKENDGATELTVFAAFGYDIYINQTDMPTEYTAMKGIVTSFLNTYLPPHYQSKIEKSEKDLKKLKKTQDKLDKLLKKNAKKIEKLEAQIETAKTDSVTNKEALKTNNEKLDSEKKKLEQVLKRLGSL